MQFYVTKMIINDLIELSTIRKTIKIMPEHSWVVRIGSGDDLIRKTEEVGNINVNCRKTTAGIEPENFRGMSRPRATHSSDFF